MRRVPLVLAVAVLATGFVRAQESTGAMPRATRELTADAAKRVRSELIELEKEKVNCFSSVGEDAGWSADWIKWHDADGIIHISDRLRSKAEVMDELRSGMRRNLVNIQTNHIFHIYGDGGDGTTVVETNSGPPGAMNMYGIRHASGPGGEGLGIDVWYKQGGRWWFIAHCPGTGEPEPPTGESAQPVE
jgi:hypothetical protein